ncbi:ArsR/SmtB family transcription factor [Methanosarcina horonobensis]|uniref:ArsR/SmtB family transcription factor n=1 Tax=Methanosarcina horonobensis TaxID=418008 RepID=UPI000B132C63|nr:winged helix-turn-helix domain-containing protein [Methanosarcina horonobensis]
MNGFEDQDGLSETGEPPQGPGLGEQDNRVLVLPVNGDSRKITQILSNETSLKILELLGKKSMSATNIAEELNLPLTTVKYNLDSLVESDLIKVKQIKWSQKGRQVKIYESVEKLIVLVPSRNPIDKLSIISLLQKYIGVIGAAVFAAAGIEYLSAYLRAKSIIDATAPLRMGVTGPANETYPAATIMENVEDGSPSPKAGSPDSTFDKQEVPEEEVMTESLRLLPESRQWTEQGQKICLQERKLLPWMRRVLKFLFLKSWIRARDCPQFLPRDLHTWEGYMGFMTHFPFILGSGSFLVASL